MLRGLVCAAGVLLVLVLAPAAQAARRAPCVEGGARPLCTFWDAKVDFVADGDTVHADVAGDGTHALKSIRFAGINAMELTRYSRIASRRRGACHGLQATSLVERYIRRSRWRVRVAAQRAGSRAGRRLRRSVWVKVAGRWRDLSRLEMERGLALWMPDPIENAHNHEYLVLTKRAIVARKGLYDPAACGTGPDQGTPVDLTINWDADGDDRTNLNGEWVDIHNGGTSELRLGRWVVRDSWRRDGPGLGYRMPAGTAVPAGGTLRLRVGCGRDSALELHWCLKQATFDNPGRNRLGGGGAYLFDPDGDVRASGVYPCVAACSDPLAGKVRLAVHPSGRESISIANVSGAPVDLGGHTLKMHVAGRPDAFLYGVPFRFGTVIPAGGELTVDPGGSPADDTALVRHLGRGEHALADGTGTMSLRTFDDLVTACDAWGAGRC